MYAYVCVAFVRVYDADTYWTVPHRSVLGSPGYGPVVGLKDDFGLQFLNDRTRECGLPANVVKLCVCL